MHICCSNCAIYPITVVKHSGIDVKCLWFNPNIHPYTEYKNRLESVKRLQVLWDLDVTYIDCYGLREFLRNTVCNEGKRCEYCYTVRLEEAAKRAKEINADAFSTTLLVSPYQNFDIILNIGRVMQERYDIEFYARDFRIGFKECRMLSKELGLYRQRYCGCIYSEMERYLKSADKKSE